MASTQKISVAMVDQILSSSLISNEKRDFLNNKRKQVWKPDDTIDLYRWPRRFEMEGLDPYQLKVEIVTTCDRVVFDNILEAEQKVNLKPFMGPMAGMIDDQWCIRFESESAYKLLSQ
jgi:hypothetical protein